MIVARPVARAYDHHKVAEVTRLVTDGTKNACSFLYAAAARVARDMGFECIQTYILDAEPGVSLRAAGWTYAGLSPGGTWDRPRARQLLLDAYAVGMVSGRRLDQPLGPKQRWEKILVKAGDAAAE